MIFLIVLKNTTVLCMLTTLLSMLPTEHSKNVENYFIKNDHAKIVGYFKESQMIINLGKRKTESNIFGTGNRLVLTKNQLDVTYRGQSIENVSEETLLINIFRLTITLNFEVFKRQTADSNVQKIMKKLLDSRIRTPGIIFR